MPDDSLFEDPLDEMDDEEPPEPLPGQLEIGDDPTEGVEIPTPEQLSSLPLQTAAQLLSEEEETPPPPSESEPPPPGERHGPFIVQKAPGYGDGYRDLILDDDVYLPVGVWLHERHPNLTGPEVESLLAGLGLPAERAGAFARQRQSAREAQLAAISSGAVQGLLEMEARHSEIKDAFSREFVKQQQRQKEKR